MVQTDSVLSADPPVSVHTTSRWKEGPSGRAAITRVETEELGWPFLMIPGDLFSDFIWQEYEKVWI